MNQEYVYVTLSSKEELFENIIAILSNFPILGIEEIEDNLKVALKKENWDKIDKEFFLEALKVADPNISIIQIDKELERGVGKKCYPCDFVR
jgi:hypothetical protein